MAEGRQVDGLCRGRDRGPGDGNLVAGGEIVRDEV
jgi:hypothetical protein